LLQPMPPTIAVIGASADRRKFGNKAVRAFVSRGYRVFPINPHVRVIEGLTAYASIKDVPVARLDLVTVYVPPEIGWSLLPEIAQMTVGEVMINPGAESAALLARGVELGLTLTTGCSILAIGVNPHMLDD
jgi:predicted CoA-binding protein